MSKLLPLAKVIGVYATASFALPLAVLQLQFWPFSPLQKLLLGLCGGALLTWYFIDMAYQDSELAVTFHRTIAGLPSSIRISMSSPLRKPYVIIQRQEQGRWVTHARCDLAKLPLSLEDREKMISFLEDIPTRDNLRQRVQDYVLDHFSRDAFTLRSSYRI